MSASRKKARKKDQKRLEHVASILEVVWTEFQSRTFYFPTKNIHTVNQRSVRCGSDIEKYRKAYMDGTVVFRLPLKNMTLQNQERMRSVLNLAMCRQVIRLLRGLILSMFTDADEFLLHVLCIAERAR